MVRSLLAIAALAGLDFVVPATACAHAPDDERLHALSQRLEEDPDDPELYWARAEIHRITSHWEPALADYARALALDPKRYEIHDARARLYLATSQLEKAREATERYCALRPQDPSGLRTRARILKAQGHDREAARDFEHALEVDPRPRPADFLECAQIWTRLGDAGQERALRVLDDGIRRLAEPVALLWRAWKLEAEQGEFDQALRRLTRLEQVLPRPALALAHRGDLLFETGQTLEAEVCWTRALEDLEDIPERKQTVFHSDLAKRLRDRLSGPELEASSR